MKKEKNYLFPFMEELIDRLKNIGKTRTAETYNTTLNSFKRFRNGKDMTLNMLDSDVITAYEGYLKRSGVSANSSSFYMRNLRAVYNRAVEKGLTLQQHPFKHVYTGVDKTIKRAISLKAIKEIKNLDLTEIHELSFARDIFLFSFFTRGMSFVDIAYLRKINLKGNTLTYRRRKTGKLLNIRWEKCMQEIVNRYDTGNSPYIFPVIKVTDEVEGRKQYINMAHNVNRKLKSIGKMIKLPQPLTMYVARHTWASIARSKNVPLSIISEGMGHDSELTTRIYLASLDTVAIDKANHMILSLLQKD